MERKHRLLNYFRSYIWVNSLLEPFLIKVLALQRNTYYTYSFPAPYLYYFCSCRSVEQ